MFQARKQAKKLKPPKKTPDIVSKNPVTTLNELKPGLPYILVETRGPVHDPIFVIEVNLNGQAFRGEGKSKKSAKHEAAAVALRYLVVFVQHKQVKLVFDFVLHLAGVSFNLKTFASTNSICPTTSLRLIRPISHKITLKSLAATSSNNNNLFQWTLRVNTTDSRCLTNFPQRFLLIDSSSSSIAQ